MNRVEAIVDYFTGEDCPDSWDNIAGRVVEHIDQVFSNICRLIQLMEESTLQLHEIYYLSTV